MGEISASQEYKSFRSTVPLRTIIVDDDDSKKWLLYDAGPKSVRCPLMCLPPASGSADIFFRQILPLTGKGYRVIAVEYPIYWTLEEWTEGFRKLLDALNLDKVHLFGASLGGFLAQKFAEYTFKSPRVHSMILCNSFADTNIFQQTQSAASFWMLPALVLRKMVMGNFEKGLVDSEIADSIDFMVDKLDNLGQQELASRLTLNCQTSYIEPQKVNLVEVTLMDVFDDCALSQSVKDEMYKCYPSAKRAHMKTGGNFPYLSRSEDVNLYIQIHLRPFMGSRFSALEELKTDQNMKDSEQPSTLS